MAIILRVSEMDEEDEDEDERRTWILDIKYFEIRRKPISTCNIHSHQCHDDDEPFFDPVSPPSIQQVP